jgi:peptide/nickel transport system substrate-binding protein
MSEAALRSRRLAGPLAAALVALALPLAAAAQDSPMVVNYSLPPPTLDPAFDCDITDLGFISTLYPTLLRHPQVPLEGAPEGITVTHEDAGALEGYVAESWTTSDDGKTLTFKIRDGIKFSTGRPMDAAAVAASLNRALASGACGTYFTEAAQFGNTESITAGEGNTVVIKLKKAEPLVLYALTVPATGIVDVAEAEANGGDEWLASHVAGGGPYTLAEYQPGVRAVFKANPTFFGTAPREPEVVVNFITDNATLLLQARNGQADVTLGLSKTAVASLVDDPSVAVIQVPTARWQIISFPTKQPPFDNVKLRQALTYAVPYEAILKNVAQGFGQLYFGPFPPAFPAYNPEYGAPREFDLDKAKALIAESGVQTPIPLEMVIREGQNDVEQIATIVQAAWSQIGVNVTIRKLPASGHQQAVTAPVKTASIIRFDGPSVADPAWLLDYDMRANSVYNMSNYDNPEAEKLLDEAHPLSDPAARQAIWDKIAAMWIEDAPRVPVYADVYTAVAGKNLKYWSYSQNGPFDLDQWGR